MDETQTKEPAMSRIETSSRVRIEGTEIDVVSDIYQDVIGRTWCTVDGDRIECHQAPTGWVVRE